MKPLHKFSIYFAILAILASSLGMGWLGGALAKGNVVGAVPSVVSYQGYLTGVGGLPYNGSADFIFSIYDTGTGGSQLWTESLSGVTVSNGYFTVLLGSSNPLTASVFSATTHYLETQVDTGTGMTTLPRQVLSSVPFALHAEYADTATYANSAGIASSASSVDWTGLTSVPAGFADGVDDTGLASLPPIFTRTPLDTSNPGGSSDIVIGVDGLPLILYSSGSNQLKVAHCNDVNCTGASIYTLDSGLIGSPTIAIGSDNLGIISYHDAANDDLKVAHCNNIPCSSATLTTLDSAGNVGAFASIAIAGDGLPLIAYINSDVTDLKVAHCLDAACTSATFTTYGGLGITGELTSIAIGTDGYGLISYFDSATADLLVAHCNDYACTTAAHTPLDTNQNTGFKPTIAIGSDGLGLISYAYLDSVTLHHRLKMAHCNDIACSSASIITVDSSVNAGYVSTLAIGSDGLGIIFYTDLTNATFKVAHCSNLACNSFRRYTLPLRWQNASYGLRFSIAIGTDNLPVISYYDEHSGLSMIHCDDVLCAP